MQLYLYLYVSYMQVNLKWKGYKLYGLHISIQWVGFSFQNETDQN